MTTAELWAGWMAVGLSMVGAIGSALHFRHMQTHRTLPGRAEGGEDVVAHLLKIDERLVQMRESLGQIDAEAKHIGLAEARLDERIARLRQSLNEVDAETKLVISVAETRTP